jgi:hypothetical protein
VRLFLPPFSACKWETTSRSAEQSEAFFFKRQAGQSILAELVAKLQLYFANIFTKPRNTVENIFRNNFHFTVNQ